MLQEINVTLQSRQPIYADMAPEERLGSLSRHRVAFVDPRVGQLFYDYWALYRDHLALSALSEEIPGYKLSNEDFISIHGRPPWEIYQSWIDRLGLTLYLDPPDLNSSVFEGVRIRKNGISESLPIYDLSSGERVYLNLALSTLVVQDGRIDVTQPDVLLLDEPDAHLHPSLSRDLLYNLLIPLSERGICVIMSSHSPTTIAVAPESSLYEKIDGSGLAQRSKQHALSSLMFGVPHISLDPSGRRQVFVESEYDRLNYSFIYDYIRPYIDSEKSLMFIAAGQTSVQGDLDSGRKSVERLVNELRGAGNQLVYGLVDGDGRAPSGGHIVTLADAKVYSIENIVLNPFSIAYILNKLKISPFQDHEIRRFLLDEVDYQEVSDVVLERLGVHDERKVIFQFVSGKYINVPKSILLMNGHSYETMILEKFPALKSVTRGRANGLMHHVIGHVFKDQAGWIPSWVLDTFRSIAEL